MPLVTVFGGSGGIGRQVVKLLAQRGDQVRVAVTQSTSGPAPQTDGRCRADNACSSNIRNLESVSRRSPARIRSSTVGILTESGPQKFPRCKPTARIMSRPPLLPQVSITGPSFGYRCFPSSPSAYARSRAAGEGGRLEAFPNTSILRQAWSSARTINFSIGLPPWRKFRCRSVFGCGFPRMTMDGLKIYGDGGTRFQPVYVGDVAQAIVTYLENAETNGKTYELGGPQVYSFCELMELVLQETRRWRR